jgi:hypothetical protein
MKADRKKRASDDAEALARRSRRIHAFLGRWARRHMPERVTRFRSR